MGDWTYSYDAGDCTNRNRLGNLLTQVDARGCTTTLGYDTANRLEYVDEQLYTWDANGNLLSDGDRAYTYDHANRLAGVSASGLTVSMAYNGLGDRLQQTVNGTTTTYTLDLATGLTQVLADGSHTYLYGAGRVAQYTIPYVGTSEEYFLVDALGSVRQLADHNGAVTLAQGYWPYGEDLESAGSAATSYGFAGEWTDSSGLVYLRARYYDPAQGRFTTRDTWRGRQEKPMSYNGWLYTYANPINLVDPSGHDPWWCDETPDPDACRAAYYAALDNDQYRIMAATIRIDFKWDMGTTSICASTGQDIISQIILPISGDASLGTLVYNGGPVIYTHNHWANSLYPAVFSADWVEFYNWRGIKLGELTTEQFWQI